ncbi:WhiB family transcriptional regulator [Nonomuraea sp. PA05]|uniref:WhiB family transcriptional regulator n=1 Tax=Nonomuraea sp. PA05 TaxID=2604466 RepID=UPI0011D56CCD|nr:WhiB family transcriptional regulator [Nonomuraea sp. PA05]TYB71179.1 WhiB family transcriptional regulator [Nonomuraea sp. PA05]
MSRYRTALDLRATGSVNIPQAPSWHRDAACLRVGHDLFFGPASDLPRELRETTEEKVAREARARAMCRGCPVRRNCHVYIHSFPIGDQVGIWADTDQDERRVERRKNQRKTAAARRRRAEGTAP